MNNLELTANMYLRQAYGKEAEFRDGQLEAIMAVVFVNRKLGQKTI